MGSFAKDVRSHTKDVLPIPVLDLTTNAGKDAAQLESQLAEAQAKFLGEMTSAL